MGRPSEFEFSRHAYDIVITHGGKRAVTLRGDAAVRFLQDIEQGDPQQVMARVTGDYKRGNERVARDHPRNR
jgi:hypothetical protein